MNYNIVGFQMQITVLITFTCLPQAPVDWRTRLSVIIWRAALQTGLPKLKSPSRFNHIEPMLLEPRVQHSPLLSRNAQPGNMPQQRSTHPLLPLQPPWVTIRYLYLLYSPCYCCSCYCCCCCIWHRFTMVEKLVAIIFNDINFIDFQVFTVSPTLHALITTPACS